MAPPTNFAFLLFLLSVLGQICYGDDHANVLFTNEPLFQGDTLINGDYTFKLQDNCKFGLFDAGKRIWESSNPGLKDSCYSIFHSDGHLEIVARTWGYVWSNLSPDQHFKIGHYVLILQNDRNVVIHGPSLWSAPSGHLGPNDATNMIITDDAVNKGCVLYSRQRLNAGESLQAGSYSLVMQEDCNLVLYESEKPIWSTKTNGRGQNCYLEMRYDGNLVVYRRDFRELWTAFDTRKDYGDYVLVLQRWGKIVIYGTPVWATGTNITAVDVNSSTAEAITATNGVAAVL